eukprot:TRINITY_DN12015_c0_g2_i1.p1 TRINITY_DN12015_c0_g2~~TRINITY_DN12015_c0_g2_i1.p1  ORF type:complete len:590 (+),score=170.01 TRINITY_DN12015_c0_g2_i1:104-1771(+)
MATLPLRFFVDAQNGNPVWLMRYAEWLLTCPTLLYWVGLCARGQQDLVAEIASGDALLLAAGVLSSFLPASLAKLLFVGGALMFVAVMFNLWNLVSKAMATDTDLPTPLPKKALNMIRWEILLSWSLFPLIEVSRRYFGLSYQAGEALNCIADYAAKVGLAMIMVNCNLEQMNYLKVQQMQQAVTGLVKFARKTHMLTSADVVGVDGMDQDVRAWLVNEFDGCEPMTAPQRRKPLSKRTAIDPSTLQASDLFKWDFNSLDLEDGELDALCARVFHEMKIVETFGLSNEQLDAFIGQVHKRYNANPFHNFHHAAMVLHTAYMMITTVCVNACTPLERFAYLVAALCHDLEHNGLNNAFHANSQSKLAIRYNDKSILENHHCATAFEIMLDDEVRLTSVLSPDDYKVFRRIIVETILSTDMAEHGAKLVRLEQINELGGFEDLAENDDKRRFVLAALLHSADLYNPIKPDKVTSAWAQRLQNEFNAQVELEEKMGLPSLPFMKGSGPLALAKGEIGFISFVIMPWYTQLVRAFPVLQPLKDQIDANLEMWKARAEDA